MLVKVVTVFLIGMAILGAFGGLRTRRRRAGARRTARQPSRCPSCGTHMIGQGPCLCGAGRRDS